MIYTLQVLIINGEVVSDSDPRAIKARGGGAPSSSSHSAAPGINQRRQPATIHNRGEREEPNASKGTSQGEGRSFFQGKAYTTSEGAVKDSPRPLSTSSVSESTYYPSPPFLQQAAEALGTQGRFVTIPAVPLLGLSASTFDLLPCLCAALGTLYFGWRGVGALVFFYVLVKKNQGARHGNADGVGQPRRDNHSRAR